MRVDEISSGKFYVDANIFYMLLRPHPDYQTSIRAFMKRVLLGEIELYLSPLTTDELHYRLLLARVREAYNQNPLDVLRNHPVTPIQQLASEINTALEHLLKLPHLFLVSISKDDVFKMLDNTEQYALMPRDALHLAIIQRLHLSHIISDDRDFDRVPEIQRHWIMHHPLS